MNVLNIKIKTCDDEMIPLRELIEQTTDQPILNHRYQLDSNGDLISYTAWTEDYVLVLVYTAFGRHLLKTERNYKEQ